MESLKKCSNCKVNLPMTQDHFKLKRNGDFTKQCINCCNMKNKSQIKNKCEHNRIRNNCKECGGSSICEHNRQRSKCKECSGPTICEHNRQRHNCKECGGSSICEHNRQQNNCKECGGSSFCEHNRKRCECKECGGSSICEHNRQRSKCKECNNPIPITIKKMIRSSKESDKKYNRYDQTNFIDYCFVENLIDDCKNKCFYCDCNLQYVNYEYNLATIERLDNSIGHIKGNCVIACRTCNFSRVGQIPI